MKKLVLLTLLMFCSVAFADYNAETFTGNSVWATLAVTGNVSSYTKVYNGSFAIQPNVSCYAYITATGNVVTPSVTLATAGSIYIPAGSLFESAPDYGLRLGKKISFVTATGAGGNVSILDREDSR